MARRSGLGPWWTQVPTFAFPASIAGALGIAIPNQNASPFSGTSDSPQIAYFDTVHVVISNGNPNEAPISFGLYAGFCETLEHVGIGLPGQEGFSLALKCHSISKTTF
jgi:hypothetical protein